MVAQILYDYFLRITQVEICLTSNIKSLSVSSLDVHHFGMHSNHNFISQYFCSVKFFKLHYFMEKLANNVNSFFVSVCAVDLYNSEHPLILCTDDSGVFSTSVSGEYILASTKFGTSIFYLKIDSFGINILVTIFPTISKIWDRKKCSNLQAGQLTSFLLTKELKRNWRRYLYQLLKSWTYNYNCFQFQISHH